VSICVYDGRDRTSRLCIGGAGDVFK